MNGYAVFSVGKTRFSMWIACLFRSPVQETPYRSPCEEELGGTSTVRRLEARRRKGTLRRDPGQFPLAGGTVGGLLCAVLALALLLAGCAPAATPTATPTAERVPVRLAMGFIPNVQFTPIYVAYSRGYFAQEGIDLTFDYGMETDLLKLLGAGERQFVIGSGDQVALARANGLPVRYVLNWYRRFPVCVVALASSGIEKPQDLVGRTVGTPVLEGASYIGWRAFVNGVGVDPAKVNLQVIGYAQAASLTEKRVDAAICYAMNEPVQLRTAGTDVRVFYLDQYANLPSNGLITNEQTIKDHPELVQGMVRAFLHGLSDTIADPDAAFAITKQMVPETGGQNEVLQRAVLAECIRFWQGDPLGQSDPASWRAVVDLLRQVKLLNADVDPESLYTNRFVTGNTSGISRAGSHPSPERSGGAGMGAASAGQIGGRQVGDG